MLAKAGDIDDGDPSPDDGGWTKPRLGEVVRREKPDSDSPGHTVSLAKTLNAKRSSTKCSMAMPIATRRSQAECCAETNRVRRPNV